MKIEILNSINHQDLEQLKFLITEYIIYLNLKNKDMYANMGGEERTTIVDAAIKEFTGKITLSILDLNDIRKIENEIATQIDFAKAYISDPNRNNKKTRYYILKDANTVVGFMQAQIEKNNIKNRIEGLRNLAYVTSKYSGVIGETIDSSGDEFIGFYSEAIYQDISKWFGENNVDYEKIATGINMSHHITSYIKIKRFIPVDKNSSTLFLEKNLKKQLYRRSLDKIFRLFFIHKSRNASTTPENIMQEINSTPELVFLSEEQKLGLVKSFLTEEEKEKYSIQLKKCEDNLKISKSSDGR